jgi:hypothetical protein
MAVYSNNNRFAGPVWKRSGVERPAPTIQGLPSGTSRNANDGCVLDEQTVERRRRAGGPHAPLG